MNPLTLSDFLVWLATGGGAAVAISKIGEMIPWFVALPSNTKKIVQYGLSALVGCAAFAIMSYAPPEVLDAIAPYFAILASLVVPIFVNQSYHSIVRSTAIIKATEGMLDDGDSGIGVMASARPHTQYQFKRISIAGYEKITGKKIKAGILSPTKAKALADWLEQAKVLGVKYIEYDETQS